METIIRKIKKVRGDKVMIYDFQTFSYVFGKRSNLESYIANVFIKGVDMATEMSASAHPELIIKTKKVESDLVEHAKNANYRGKGNMQHSCVQEYLLKFDPYTVACELPCRDGDLSCFIDVVRVLGERVQVVDFKPKAHKERKAATQVFLNMKLLAKTAHIPFSSIDGFYFDDENCYQVIV